MTVTPNPTIWHDRLPGMGAWLNDFGQPYQGSVVLEFDARLNRSDGLAIHPAARKYEYQIGDPAQQPQELRDHFEAYWRAFYETAGWIPYPTVPFTPEAWAAFWTRYCQAAIFFRFPANDDPDVIQHGWKMHVIEKLTGAKSEDYWVDVPLKLLDSPIGGININSTLAVPKSSVKADLAIDTPGGLVTIGRDGKINPAWLPEGSGTAAWDGLAGKPRYIAAGATPASAREAIGAAPATAVLTPDQQAMLEDLDRALASKLDKTALTAATDAAPGVVVLASDDDVAAGTPGRVMTVPQVKGLLDGLGNVIAAYYDSAAGWPPARPSNDVTATVLCINLTAERVDKPSWYIEGVDLFAEWGYVDDVSVESFWATVAASTTVMPNDLEALTAITVTTDTGDLIPAIAFEPFHRGQRVWCIIVGAQTYALGTVTPPTPGTLLSKLQIRDSFASQFGDTDLSLRAVEGGFVHVAGRIKSATELPAGDTQFIGFVGEPFMAANIYGGGTAEVYGRVDLPASVHQAGSIIPNGAFVQIAQHGGVSFYTSAAGTDIQVNGLYVSKWADLVVPSRDLKVFQGTTFAKWLVDHTDKDGQPLEEGKQFSIRAARGKNPKLANICFHSGMGGEFAADSFNREVARLTGSHFYNLDITSGNYKKMVDGVSVQIMHVNSNLFDEPRAVELVAGARRTIAWHGCADFTETFRDDEGPEIDWGQYATAAQRSSLDISGNWMYPAAMAVVGGTDAEFRAAVIDALNAAGFVAVDAVTTRKWSPASMSWVNPFEAMTGAGARNICNQGPLGGVQIELTNTMRGIAAANGVAEAYVNRLTPQPAFYTFTAAVAAVMTEWGDR